MDFKTDNITRSPKMPVINWSKKSCYNGPIENRGQTFDCLYFGHCALLFIVPIQWNLSVNTSHGNSKMWSLYTSSFWLNITENGLMGELVVFVDRFCNSGLCLQVVFTQHRFDCITKHFKMFIILNQILMCREKEMDNFIWPMEP